MTWLHLVLCWLIFNELVLIAKIEQLATCQRTEGER